MLCTTDRIRMSGPLWAGVGYQDTTMRKDDCTSNQRDSDDSENVISCNELLIFHFHIIKPSIITKLPHLECYYRRFFSFTNLLTQITGVTSV